MNARLGGHLARAALLIAAITVLARVVGFARVGVLARTVGPSCLGSAYHTANLVPNVVFEVVAGGALATLVVPVLAGYVGSGDREAARRTASALLTWTVLLLVPVTLLGFLVARPVVGALLGEAPAGCDRDEMVRVAAAMLVVFLPQVVLYGVGIVLTGVLQAHRRFLGPALAPLLSSLVVIAAYLAYATRASAEASRDLAELPTAQLLVLSVGTTLGVAVLSLSLLVPLRRTGLRLRPGLSFPPGVAATVRRLALGGAAGLVAQQVSVAVVLRLANDGAGEGAVLVYALAQTVFLLPWAVLAVPIATSAFPELSARASAGDDAAYAATAASTLRAVLLVTLAAAAVLVAVAEPAARVLVLGAPGPSSVEPLADAIRAFAPGLVGYGLLAHLGRALYARGDARTPAVATVVGWGAVVTADLVLAQALPAADRVAALALGNTVGMTLAGVLLLAGLARATGRAGLSGLPRAAGAGGAAALAAGAAGLGAAAALGPADAVASAAQALLVGLVGAAAFAAVLLLLDRSDVLALARRRG